MKKLFVCLLICCTFVLAQADLTLLDPGAEPRQPLRYRPEAGTVMNTEMTLEMRTTTNMIAESLPSGLGDTPMSMPTMTYRYQQTVQEVNPDGSFVLEGRYLDATLGDDGDIPAFLRFIWRASMRSMIGMESRIIMTERGETETLDFTVPDTVNQFIANSLGDMSNMLETFNSLFPEEAVGIGARWQISASDASAGFPMTITTEYHLVERSEDTVTLEMTITQAAEPGSFGAPGVPAARLDLLAMEGSGAGRMVVDLGLRSLSGQMVNETITTMTMGGEDDPMETVQDMRFEMNIRSF